MTKIVFEYEIPNIEAEYSLPALSGSEKQIAWARKIRATVMVEIIDRIAAARRTLEAKKEERRSKATQGARAITDAAWWIENRDQGGNVIEVLLSKGE